jgi:glyoxylase-like metal-dependent hydrolase (beta-lactamase superfamily II)
MRMSGIAGLRVVVPVLCLLGVGASAFAADTAAAPAAPAARVQKFMIGNYSAFALEDGALQEPNDGKSFVLGRPPAEVAQVLKAGGAPGDHFEFDIHPLLVRTKDRVLLFDTGAGSSFGPIAGKLPESLAMAGIAPASVTDIFISHAHGDHIGGLVTSSGALLFPNAAIHISTAEWQWLGSMKADEARQVGIAQLSSLVTAIKPKVVAFQPGATLLPGLVTAIDIKGHTPGHSGYEIGSGESSVLYIGDAMHSYVVSVGRPMWKVAFDKDQDVGAASRVALDKREAASGQRVFAVHFPFPGIGRIVPDKDSYRWSLEALH